MRIEYLQYLLEVAHAGSISAAANKLFLGQTTLSSIINSLESELKVRIFNRTHKGVDLTAQGEQVVALSEEIVSKYVEMLRSAAGEVSGVKSLSLIAYPGACGTVGLHLSGQLMRTYENVAFFTHETPSTKIVDRVIDGMANLAIGSSAKDEFFRCQHKAHDSGLTFEHLYTDEFSLCVNADSRFAGRDSVDFEELLEEHVALTPHYKMSAASSVGRIQKQLSSYTVFANTEIVKKAVLLNDMVTIVPGLVLYNDAMVESGQLKRIRLTGFETELYNYLVCNEKRELSPLERHLADEIRSYYGILTREAEEA